MSRGQMESNKTIAAMMAQQLNDNKEFAAAAAQVMAAQEKNNEEEKNVSRPRLIYTDIRETEATRDNMKDVLAEQRFWSTGSDLKAWVNNIPEEIGPKRSNYNLEVSNTTPVTVLSQTLFHSLMLQEYGLTVNNVSAIHRAHSRVDVKLQLKHFKTSNLASINDTKSFTFKGTGFSQDSPLEDLGSVKEALEALCNFAAITHR